jgi:aromatic ring-opening dioxygenase catalytic subunit (LigB family)
MVYDYGGFPAEMYKIRYPSPGAPEVAERVRDLLEQSGIPAAFDSERGYDHGTFSPLKAMYPDADVPVLQLSLKHGYDVGEHLAAGRAIAPLRDEGIAVVASGLSWHNLGLLFAGRGRESSKAFDAWVDETLAAAPGERVERLMRWTQAPMARVSHPTEDHFVPLMVALGAAEREAAHRVYHEEDFAGSVTASSYRFGDAPKV